MTSSQRSSIRTYHWHQATPLVSGIAHSSKGMSTEPPMSSDHEKDVVQEWRESAPYWAKHADTVRTMFAPITTALISAADIREGHVVLDVAGGFGEPSMSISSVVRASGSVICTDAVGEMVATARREAHKYTLTNIEFTQCRAESLPFFDQSFDAVVCRLGVMLFSDAGAAIHEMLRVVKRGGQMSCAVWCSRDSNPFFGVVMDVVSRYIASPPEDPDAPGAFRFAERDKLAGMLEEAGAVEVCERLLNFDLEAPITPKQFWELRVELSDTLRAKIASLSHDQLERVAREVEVAGGAFFTAGRMRFPGQVLIVTGRKG
jgi:SAM-dependent methyltransferase